MHKTFLGRISSDLLVPKDRLKYLIETAPYRYKVFEIPKRSKKGFRTIAQPAREIKELQYWVIKEIFTKFPVHESATAYVRGKNIFDNTDPHTKNPYLLKLDFKNFFPSIKGDDFLYYTQNVASIDMPIEDVHRLIKILFWSPEPRNELRLSIGAPSSPQLSNILLFDFDFKVTEFCSNNKITYTRYADDLTFSMQDKSLRTTTHDMIQEILTDLPSLILKINNQKTVYASKAHRRMITGLILANNGQTSLGRDRKRSIRSKIYHCLNGHLSQTEQQQLRGLLAFANNIEPDFIKRMEKKYGKNFIRRF